MFPSFTGSVRRPRQVNLSGRSTNPFAATSGSRQSPSTQSTQNTLAHAQAERILRQHERLRPPAAIAIQRSWRGYQSRKVARTIWRREWDSRENASLRTEAQPYKSEEECLHQLVLLLQFASTREPSDIGRLQHFAKRYLCSTEGNRLLSLESPSPRWIYLLLRLAQRTITVLIQKKAASGNLLELLCALATTIPKQLSRYSSQYYAALRDILVSSYYQDDKMAGVIMNDLNTSVHDKKMLEKAVVALLQHATIHELSSYEGFASFFLTIPNIPSYFGSLYGIASAVNPSLLAFSLKQMLTTSRTDSLLRIKSHEELLWLLAYFIHIRRCTKDSLKSDLEATDMSNVVVLSKLTSHLTKEISSKVDGPAVIASAVNDGHISPSSAAQSQTPTFIRNEILTLVSQDHVSNLLAQAEIESLSTDRNQRSANSSTYQAPALAVYALTLLRAFKRRGDEIRMWLYLGSTAKKNAGLASSLPAIKYYYQAASSTPIYKLIKNDPNRAVDLLNPSTKKRTNTAPIPNLDEQWQVVLLFLELYPIVLKVMDDEEFLTGATSINPHQSWTRQSALSLDQVKDLTLFLKNLAFSMYWNASEIAGVEEPENKNSIAEYFGGNVAAIADNHVDAKTTKSRDIIIAGLPGMTVNYMKGMVTLLLRMIYERDSRRNFLPSDHWLMTQWFEMDRFIPSVVQEEEEKHKIQESYGADGIDENEHSDDDDEEETERDRDNLIGTQRTQQVRNIERLKRRQRKTSRRKYLESVTPRLEILQNMPFFIPFGTRVQIFRHFVMLDQIRRRGTSDADMWRFSMMHSSRADRGKHRAKVHRDSIFDDAFAQYYDLGEGLKEPIQISFVDQFDTVEEGIDGGGVTKEFLTSVTNEAFNSMNGLDMFVENDQHLLYPNPTAMEEREEILRQADIKEKSQDWTDSTRDLLQRFEFMGRIIGKCLYEGILVDIHFAGFFLLKWALTGGVGSATRESGYRANLNDLRDLDEGLYQGLLQLKNYPGNVEDFSLYFEVTDTLFQREASSYVDQAPKPITQELCSGGSNMAVTNENRLVYISYMARHRLQKQPWKQTMAFLKGLSTIISPSWLSMFNQSELQTLVGGDASEIDVADLRRNTQYGGIYVIGDDGLEHPSVQLFWQVMQSFSDENRRKVLKFVTSTPRAPLLGFEMLNPKFSIRDSGSDQTRLPTTSTCVNLLKLPAYTDVAVLKDRLLYSINAGAGFNLS